MTHNDSQMEALMQLIDKLVRARVATVQLAWPPASEDWMVTRAREREAAIREEVRAASSALAAGKQEASDKEWKLVPRFPTTAMVDLASRRTTRNDDEEPNRARGQAIAVYLDMLDASPSPLSVDTGTLDVKESP